MVQAMPDIIGGQMDAMSGTHRTLLNVQVFNMSKLVSKLAERHRVDRRVLCHLVRQEFLKSVVKFFREALHMKPVCLIRGTGQRA